MNGFLGHARQDRVALAEGEERQTGVLTVTDAERGTRLWQIGDPDGTPREFVGSVDSHEWCGWIRNYRRFFPRDVHFVVGKSDPGRDWYYCQPSGWPIGYGRESIPTQWHIDFELPRVPARGVLLTIGIAATRGGELKIDCNQNALPVRSIDESDYRTSVCMAPDRGAYYGFRTERIPIEASLLRTGNNRISLRFGTGKNRFEAIMYDFVRMEAAE